MAKITGKEWLQRRGLPVVEGDPINTIMIDAPEEKRTDDDDDDHPPTCKCEVCRFWGA